MAKCVIETNGYITASSSSCDYMLLTSEEVQRIVGTSTDGLTIDSQLYQTVTGYLLLSFITGHALGRIAKTMGRRY